MSPRITRAACLATVALLAGCDLSPDYRRPAQPTAATYPTAGVTTRAVTPPAP